MSHWRRLQYSLIGTLVNGAQAVIYSQVFKGEIMPLATGAHQGPFTAHIQTLQTFWVATIVVLQFALLVYLLYGPVREQQVREVVPRR